MISSAGLWPDEKIHKVRPDEKPWKVIRLAIK